MGVVRTAQRCHVRLVVESLIAVGVCQVYAETLALPEVPTVQRVVDDVRPPIEPPFSGLITSRRAGRAGIGKYICRIDHELASVKGAAVAPASESQIESGANAYNHDHNTYDRKEIPQCM